MRLMRRLAVRGKYKAADQRENYKKRQEQKATAKRKAREEIKNEADEEFYSKP